MKKKFTFDFKNGLRSVNSSSKKTIGIFIAVVIVVCLGTILVAKVSSGFKLPKFNFFSSNTTESIPSAKNTNVSYVDPIDVFTALKENKNSDFMVVDLRDSQAYAKRYIRGTVNVPFDQSKPKEFVSSVEKKVGVKRVIVLPYSTFSTSGERAVQALLDGGIDADLLTIGWNELYNLPNMWLPEEKWETFKFMEMIEHAE